MLEKQRNEGISPRVCQRVEGKFAWGGEAVAEEMMLKVTPLQGCRDQILEPEVTHVCSVKTHPSHTAAQLLLFLISLQSIATHHSRIQEVLSRPHLG